MRGRVGDKPKDDKWWQDDCTFLDMICGLTSVQAQPDQDHRQVERPPASEISYVARISLRWGGRVARKWQNMTREGRAWCPPKLMTSWYEQPLMRLQQSLHAFIYQVVFHWFNEIYQNWALGHQESSILRKYTLPPYKKLPTSHINL